MKLKISVSLLMTCLLLSSCGEFLERKGVSGQENLNFSPESLDFAIVQSKIMTPYCVTCHEQYASYVAVRREVDAIAAAVNSNRMPRTGGPLPDSLKRLLGAWIAAGAPEKPGLAPRPEPVVIVPIWNSIRDNVLAPRCLVCHNPNGQARFLDLSTRRAIFDSRNRLFGADAGKKLLDFERPEESYLIDVVKDENEPMPPTWSNIRRLNGDEIRVLTNWIGLGVPE